MDKGYSGLNPYKTNKNQTSQASLGEAPLRSYDNVAVIKPENFISDETKSIIKNHPYAHPKHSPIKIPYSAKIKKKSKNGYEQVKYTWKKGQYKYEARWHTSTPGAPNNKQSWVVIKTKVGKGSNKPVRMVRSGNRWVSWSTWQEAIKARQNGIATKAQLKLLNEGHFTRKRGKK